MEQERRVVTVVREFLAEKQYDAIIVSSWQNVYYCSSFTGYGDALLLITKDKKFIITDSRYYVQAEKQSGDYELVKAGAWDRGAVADLILRENIKKVAYEDLAVLYTMYVNFFEKLGVELFGVGDLFLRSRVIKTPEELAKVEAACDLASAALERTFKYIKAGITEIELAARLEYEMRKAGADKPSFDTIIASGVRGSMPHGTASTKVIEEGDGVTIDFGAFCDGMCSDMTRTVFVGEPSAEMRKIYEIVKEAQQTAIDGYKPGMKGKDMDKLARDVIAGYGYGEYFGHSLGHGVGIDVHEGVPVSQRGEQVLEKGMIFSVEPGIYVPGLGGVRIEDLVTIGDNGKLRMITKAPVRDLLVF